MITVTREEVYAEMEAVRKGEQELDAWYADLSLDFQLAVDEHFPEITDAVSHLEWRGEDYLRHRKLLTKKVLSQIKEED